MVHAHSPPLTPSHHPSLPHITPHSPHSLSSHSAITPSHHSPSPHSLPRTTHPSHTHSLTSLTPSPHSLPRNTHTHSLASLNPPHTRCPHTLPSLLPVGSSLYRGKRWRRRTRQDCWTWSRPCNAATWTTTRWCRSGPTYQARHLSLPRAVHFEL